MPEAPGRSAEVFDSLEIVSAKGAYLYPRNGTKILDASAGAAVGNIGWGRQEVADAAAASLAELTYALPPIATRDRIALAERLVRDWLPGEMPGISFFGSGSEANEAAMRIARQYQLACGRESRWKIIGRDISYNGTSLATLAVGGHDARRKGFEPMIRDMPHANACYCLRCPLGKTYPSCKVACATGLEARLSGEAILESVCRAVMALEDDSRFNAGIGCAFRADGSAQMDAACMDSDNRFGSVAAVEGFKNPIQIALAVTGIEHRVLAGEGAAKFAREKGCRGGFRPDQRELPFPNT